MKIRLPNLSTTSCRFFIVCGKLKDDETAAIRWTKKNKLDVVARAKVDGESVVIHAEIGDSEFAGHCHLDVAPKSFFGSSLPKATATWKSIQEQFAHLEGKNIGAEVECVYFIPVDRLPRIISVTRSFDVVQDGVSIRMTKGYFQIEGAPIYAVSWVLTKEAGADIAIVRLEGRTETIIDEHYLERMFELVNNSFNSFIEGSLPSG